jgi:glycosyltransferase involved in cell wall biosynthesis
MDKKVLFCGLSVSAQSWYRCGLQAIYLDQDWLCLVNGPPNGKNTIITGGNMDDADNIDIEKYDTVVVQLGKGKEWVNFIKKYQKLGVKFLYEVDDFLHGVRRVKNHSNAKGFGKKDIKEFQEVMNVCDGMICSTDFLSAQYKKYNQNQFVCRNALDFWRYEKVKRPEKEKFVVGWSGGTGHDSAIMPALRATARLMQMKEDVIFVSAGTGYANAIDQHFPGRTKIIPWTGIENYPFVLSYFDVSLAPAHESKYHLSKSDLRWLEASAVGTPVIADPRIYKDVVDGETGLLASTEDEFFENLMLLASEKETREKIGKNAQEYIGEHRNMRTQAGQWLEVFHSL